MRTLGGMRVNLGRNLRIYQDVPGDLVLPFIRKLCIANFRLSRNTPKGFCPP